MQMHPYVPSVGRQQGDRLSNDCDDLVGMQLEFATHELACDRAGQGAELLDHLLVELGRGPRHEIANRLQLLQPPLDLCAGGLHLLLGCGEPGRAPIGVTAFPGFALDRIQIGSAPSRQHRTVDPPAAPRVPAWRRRRLQT